MSDGTLDHCAAAFEETPMAEQPVTLNVTMPLNISEYQQIALAALSELYLGFPLNNTVLNAEKIAEILKISPDGATTSGRKFVDVFNGTVEHLHSEGYIRPVENLTWKLTDKGFDRMNAPVPSLTGAPATVTANSSVGAAANSIFTSSEVRSQTFMSKLMKSVMGGI